eukprot:TRINITY_DN8720_c0_g1_i5.p1 TRINITY_DN8720_c0_g1~~TRINITY_DN8720_c0_g1_i5.p1  ORF type:complete len:248 (+),score=35.37 TRINITY_DN8720_c0_g1_i5:120-863(+)
MQMAKVLAPTTKPFSRQLNSKALSKLHAIISPAKTVDTILIDYTKSLSFSDLYDYNGQVIGAGGFGVVLQAIDKTTCEEVAVKVLSVADYCRSEQRKGALRVERGLSHLRNEVAIAQECVHENIMKVKKVHRTQEHVLIVMEKAKCSLEEYMRSRGGKLGEQEAKVIIKQLLCALRHLHISDVVHKDVKPANILLMSDVELEGAVRLTDFSVATKLRNATPHELSNTAGTFLYKAPEQFNGGVCTTV